MKPWWLLLLPGPAFAYNYLWDHTGVVDRFEMKLDNGAYFSVGLPPVASGTYTLPGDPTLTGSHSAVVRACTVVDGCSLDSNILAFTVAPTPKPLAPVNPRLVAAVAPPPPVLVESPTGTKVFVATDKIIDAKLNTWTLGPKDPAIEGGLEFTILINGVKEGGAAIFLCYSNHQVFSWSGQPNGNWYAWSGTAFQLFSPAVPAGCA